MFSLLLHSIRYRHNRKPDNQMNNENEKWTEIEHLPQWDEDY